MHQAKEHIHHQATGGTIDSEWNGSQDTAVPNRETIIPSYLETVRLFRHNVTSATSFMKDSKDVKNREQDEVAETVLNNGAKKQIVTTGTYTMDQFLIALREQTSKKGLEEMEKRIVFTGSAQPIKGYSLSDGGFNLGMAVAVLQQELKERLFLIMNGGVWDGFANIRKDLTTATFHGVKGKNILGYKDFGLVNLGGTMDSVPDGLDGMVPAKESIVPYYLDEKVSLITQTSPISPYIKNSLDLTPEDLDQAVDVVKGLTNEHILITMGMYKLREMQEHLRNALKDSPDAEKKVVLTSSRLPLNFGDQTDAPFNLGYSLGQIGFVQNGVHIAANGILMADDDNIFELIYTPEERAKLQKMGVIS
jgi:L-asparaginase/Glu-tRNA(Gln) amidotransferase subunit D